MGTLLVLGYGSTLRGDDAVGRLAAEQLQAIFTGRELDIRSVHQLTPELMEPISRAERVIFIDASLGLKPGEVLERDLSSEAAPQAFTHHAAPEALLVGARTLYGAAPIATSITVGAASFEIGEGLSDPARRGLAAVVERLEKTLRQFVAGL